MGMVSLTAAESSRHTVAHHPHIPQTIQLTIPVSR